MRPGVDNTRPSRHLLRIGLVASAMAIVIAATGILLRARGDAELRQETDELAVPSVTTIQPQRGEPAAALVLPGNVEAFYSAPIYARVNGYLSKWFVDIGASVKRGQLLAEVDTPDLDQQLKQAEADLQTAEANERLAALTAKRWKHLLGSDAVARQDVDEKLGDAEAKHALTAAAQAKVNMLQAEEGFKRIVAPFSGVVTQRNTDVGALITAGTAGLALFTVADVHEMRVYVQLPQAMSAQISPGMTAELQLPQYPNETFPATLVTTSHQISKESRTLLAELHAGNPDGRLTPGTYAEVHLTLPGNPNMLRIPTSALLFREHGLKVATVDDKGRVTLKPVKVARNSGTEIEITSGLVATDRVIDSPPDSLVQGEVVRVAESTTPQPRLIQANVKAGTGQ